MKHKGAKDFLLGAFIGGVLGITAVSIVRKKKYSTQKFLSTVSHVSKAINSEGNLSQIIDWTAEGIQLWTKLKKRS